MFSRFFLLAAMLLAPVGPSLAAEVGEIKPTASIVDDGTMPRKLVLLDNFFHHQTRSGRRFHYTWDDGSPTGYSLLGKLFVGDGAEIEYLVTAPTREKLKRCSVYIIVNPDNERNADRHKPNYMTAEAADTIEEWVKAGGTLVLMDNDKGNGEFEHFNILANRFGITFNQDRRNEAPHHEPGQMQLDTKSFQDNSVFRDVSLISMRGICTLSVQNIAKPILSAPKESGEGSDIIMATCSLGKGRVFAVGDPWLYNEYIHSADNYKAAENLVRWLMNGVASDSNSSGPFMSYPTGFTPEVVGKKIVEDLIARHHGANPKVMINYDEAGTVQGALEFSGLTHDGELQKRLIEAYAKEVGNQIQIHFKSSGAGVDREEYGIVPFEFFLQTHEPAYCALGRSMVDDEWKEPLLNNGLTNMTRFWVDDTFMVGTLLTEAWRATHDPIYEKRLGLFLSIYFDKLQQPTGLMFHGPKFPFYWGRGNGWMAVASANALTVLSPADPNRAKVLGGYKKMMATLLSYQGADGMWHQLVDHPESYEETSCTGMFTYAFIVGVKHGWLEKGTYGPAAQKGWLALVRHLDPKGEVTDVCVGTGQKDDLNFYLARPRQTGNYHGQGPLLWCANALLR